MTGKTDFSLYLIQALQQPTLFEGRMVCTVVDMLTLSDGQEYPYNVKVCTLPCREVAVGYAILGC